MGAKRKGGAGRTVLGVAQDRAVLVSVGTHAAPVLAEGAGNQVWNCELGLSTVKSQAKGLWAVTLKPWATTPTALST